MAQEGDYAGFENHLLEQAMRAAGFDRLEDASMTPQLTLEELEQFAWCPGWMLAEG